MRHPMKIYPSTNHFFPRFMWGIGMILCLVLTSCEDEWEDGSLSHSIPTENLYWYTRTRSKAEQETMLRSHGVGFSYDAIYGKKCDVGSVRCQVLDLGVLKEEDIYRQDNTGRTVYKNTCSHSFAEYFYNTNFCTDVSGEILGYKGDYSRVLSLFEHALDTCIAFTSVQSEIVCQKYIETNHWENSLDELGERGLSDNFLYALEKIKATNIENVAVVDSFINIFGTHVVVDATIGGKLQLDVVTQRKNIQTFANERTVTEQSLDLFFKKKESSLTETEQKFVKQLLTNSQLYITISGGDLSTFNTLVANPSPDNVQASEKNLSQWIESVKLDEDKMWDNKCELIDMEVAPIWEFIPDETVASRVKTRIIATAPTMQELYGNRNFLNVSFPVHPTTVTTTLGGKAQTFNSPWVVDVIAANRRVATICKEWVPEIDLLNSVQVVYPIYENRIQMEAGFCVHNGHAYQVKWLYDRFVVSLLDTSTTGDKVFLNFGYLESQGKEGVNYQEGKFIIGYEWPGSILTDGTLAKDKPYYETRKFLGNFYLNTDGKFTDLPNWTYQSESMWNSYYEKFFKELPADKQELPYELSGIQLKERSGKDHLKNRMMRDGDYVYYMNSTELGL